MKMTLRSPSFVLSLLPNSSTPVESIVAETAPPFSPEVHALNVRPASVKVCGINSNSNTLPFPLALLMLRMIVLVVTSDGLATLMSGVF